MTKSLPTEIIDEIIRILIKRTLYVTEYRINLYSQYKELGKKTVMYFLGLATLTKRAQTQVRSYIYSLNCLIDDDDDITFYETCYTRMYKVTSCPITKFVEFLEWNRRSKSWFNIQNISSF